MESINAPTISILVITYNRVGDTLALLRNLEAQKNANHYVGELLLLNNNSSDDYMEIEQYVAASKLPIVYLKHDKNLGVAGGRNFLIKRAKFPYLLVLDDDVEFEGIDAIEKIAQLMNKEQYKLHNTAIITLNIYYYNTLERQRNALPHKHYDAYKDKNWFLTYYFTGAAHLMKRELFESTGYYPEDFFYGAEEYDLSYRVINNGYTLAYDADVKVLHKESPTGRVTNSEKLSMLWQNKCTVAYRYLPKKYFYSTMFMWIFFYLKKSNWDLKGVFRNLRKIRSIPLKIASERIGIESLNYLSKVQARLWF